MKAEIMTDLKPDLQMDLRGTACPMNWVKLKLKLEEMEDHQVLEVLLDDGDAIRNVPRSAKAEGHLILQALPLEVVAQREGAAGDEPPSGFKLLIEKGGAR